MTNHINSFYDVDNTSSDAENARIDKTLRTDGGSGDDANTENEEPTEATHTDGYTENSTVSDRLTHDDGTTDVDYHDDE